MRVRWYMPSFIRTQTLEYREHREELDVLARALNLLEDRDVNGAIQVLLARHDHLIASQRPVLKDYDPRQERHA